MRKGNAAIAKGEIEVEVGERRGEKGVQNKKKKNSDGERETVWRRERVSETKRWR